LLFCYKFFLSHFYCVEMSCLFTAVVEERRLCDDVCLSVCLSQAGTMPRQMLIRSHGFCQAAQRLLFIETIFYTLDRGGILLPGLQTRLW